MSRRISVILILLLAGCGGVGRAEREADTQTTQGDVHFNQGNYPAAIQVYQQVLQQLPNFPRALLQLGRSCERLGMVDRAMQAYEGLLAANPQCPEAPQARARRSRLTELKNWDPSKGPKPKEDLD